MKVKEVINQRERKRKGYQEWEKIVSIDFAGVKDVYDFEVPESHMFIANGIVSHNCGKSQMLTFVDKTAPKSRYVAGRSASGAGLTASVVKDEFLRGWALEAGAMVLADKGILVLDEMDKISKEDTSALHEAMEQQQISIAKANIQATLRTQTSILAAANPKMGRFDPFTPIPNQIDMPPALINRFDLIFVMRDLPNKEIDANIASKVLESHSYKDSPPEISGKLLRKYIAYTRQRISPKLTEAAVDVIRTFYVELRSSGSEGDSSIKSIPISARQLEAVVRLAEASARIKLKATVDEEDAIRGINLLRGCMNEIGVDPDTGKIDIDRMTTGISASVRGRILDVRDILYELSEEKMGGPINIEDDLKPKVFEKGITERKLEEVVDALKKNGDFFEPKKGWLQKI
ncbi:ATP-binding protein [Candidatus Woesearchaeota archaeon]|nr:ATP-binding protein [Candidatus Woesearchaeota archaeon]